MYSWTKVAHLSLSFPPPLHVLSGLTIVLCHSSEALPTSYNFSTPAYTLDNCPSAGLSSRISFEQITPLLARPWMTQILGWSKVCLHFSVRCYGKTWTVFGQPNIKHLLCAMELITQSCPRAFQGSYGDKVKILGDKQTHFLLWCLLLHKLL